MTEKIKEELKKYSFKTNGIVRFSEVDSFNVVHNIKYLYWLENARIDYFRHIGIEMHNHTIIKDFPVMVVRNEIDYFNPARFSDEYNILSRISRVGNSSFTFQNLIFLKSGLLLAKASSVLVYLNESNLPERIPDNYRKLISDFEGDNVDIITD